MYHSKPPSLRAFKCMGEPQIYAGSEKSSWWGAVGMVGIWLSMERLTVIVSASATEFSLQPTKICKDYICDVIMLSSGCSSIILYCCDTVGKLEYTLLVVLAWIKVPRPNVPQVTNFILYNVTIFASDVDIYLCYKFTSYEIVFIEKYLKLLIKFQRLSNMAKHFEFTNNNSDVYVVGNSQLAGLKGISKDKNRAMNISWCRGARIQDCLAECDKRYRHKRNKVKL